MMNFGKIGGAFALAALLMVVGCGKKSSLTSPKASSAPPAVTNRTNPPAPTTSNGPVFSSAATQIGVGTFSTECESDFTMETVVINGNSMKYTVQQFSDQSCTGPGQVSVEWDSLFSLTPTQDAVYQNSYTINYLNPDGSSWYSETVSQESNGLIFSSSNYDFVKQQ